MRTHFVPVALILVASILGSAALASDPAIIPVKAIAEGDAVPSLGLVTSIDNLAVNSSGVWRVEIDTDNSSTAIDGAVVGNGPVIKLQQGQALVAPAGASISSFDALTLNDSGFGAGNLFLSGTTGTSDDSGIFFDAKLVLQEGTISTAPAFSPGTPYIGFFETKFNNAGQVLVVASMDDPAIATSVDRALVGLLLDGAGNLVSETVFAKEGDVLAGQTAGVSDFGTGPHNFALSDSGIAMFFADTADVTSMDGNVYLGSTLLAREGFPSPLAGRNWLSLSSSRMDVSAAGDHHVYTGQLDGTTTDDQLIVKDDAKFMQEGDSLPAIGGFLFTSFGTGAVRITGDGDVVWTGDWDDPDTTKDVGLFLNEKLLVQEGVTTIGGVTVESLATGQDNFSISQDGRYIIFEATLTGSISGAFLIDRGPWLDLGNGKPGTNGVARLLGSGTLTAGTNASLCLTNALPSAPAILVLGFSLGNFPFFGGTLVPFPNFVVSGFATDANGELFLTAPWPAGVPSGFAVFAQYILPDTVAVFDVALSNAVVGTAP